MKIKKLQNFKANKESERINGLLFAGYLTPAYEALFQDNTNALTHTKLGCYKQTNIRQTSQWQR